MVSRSDLPDGAAVGSDRIADRAPRKNLASAGFGSPGEDVTVRRIDLNDALIRHHQSTFVMRAAGDTMMEAGIADEDVLLVDRALKAEHGNIVIAVMDGELVCRRLHKRRGRMMLVGASAGAPDITPGDDVQFEIWGVVTTAIKSLLP